MYGSFLVEHMINVCLVSLLQYDFYKEDMVI
jgi:hypothetical protein